MRDRLFIVSGLALFLILFSYPVWRAAALHTRAAEPRLQLPARGSRCVLPAEAMRSAHMALLYRWRAEVVRGDVHQARAYDGRVVKMSLSRTCLDCHSKAQFCDRCHAYSGLSGASAPTCWRCHSDPRALAAGRMP